MWIRGVWNFLVILIVFVLAMVGAMPSAWAASESDSSSATIYVPDDYPTIQAAVDAASSGDTIIVRDGEYRENINVKKRVTIKSENGSGNCIVDAEDREDDVFWVFADYVNINGFTVRGATGWGDAGIYLYSADYCNISNNICSNNEYGSYLDYSCNNTISGNNVSGNNDDGIYLDKSSNNNSISGNDVSGNNDDGIYLDESSNNNSISGNDVSGNSDDGISLDKSRNNSISGNDVSNNDGGIVLLDSSNNSISSNTVCNNNYYGIGLDYSCDNTISGNTFVNDGLFVHSSYHNTVGGNTVNNKPLVYLEDASDYKIEDAGQVILINCRNITAENLNLSDTCNGIVLLGTEDSIIADNTVSSITLYRTHSNVNGIFALYRFSNNNTISSNTVSGNNYIGIGIWSSNNNTISDNTVSGNNDIGIDIGSSNNNTISGNTVKNNDIGIDLQNSRNNTIYLNNFINNTDNVDAYESTDIWNSTEEITYTYKTNQYTNYMGNYWSDYTGTDSEGDGIGDRPYPANSDNDNYPLMERFENYFKPTPPTAFITCSSSVIPVKTSKSASRL